MDPCKSPSKGLRSKQPGVWDGGGGTGVGGGKGAGFVGGGCLGEREVWGRDALANGEVELADAAVCGNKNVDGDIRLFI